MMKRLNWNLTFLIARLKENQLGKNRQDHNCNSLVSHERITSTKVSGTALIKLLGWNRYGRLITIYCHWYWLDLSGEISESRRLQIATKPLPITIVIRPPFFSVWHFQSANKCWSSHKKGDSISFELIDNGDNWMHTQCSHKPIEYQWNHIEGAFCSWLFCMRERCVLHTLLVLLVY